MNLRTSGTYRLPAAACAVAAIITVSARGPSAKEDAAQRGGESYTVALFGDMPYNALGRAQYPTLLADINASHVAFSVFDGDLRR